MLADALPDRFGNALTDRWMSERGIERDQVTVIDRLADAADRAIGALEVRPPVQDPDLFGSTALQLADLVVAARSAIRGDTSVAVDQGSLEQLIAVGTSAGGARPKAAVADNPATNQIRSAYRATCPTGSRTGCSSSTAWERGSSTDTPAGSGPGRTSVRSSTRIT